MIPSSNSVVSQQPVSPKDVVFDGGVTILSADEDTVFDVRSFTLRNGALLVIGANNLAVKADEMHSEGGRIIAYDPAVRAASGQNGVNAGDPGHPGTAGRNSGSVTLILGTLTLADPAVPLIVDLSGEAGGDGGDGVAGAAGGNGSPGANAKGHRTLFLGEVQITCDRAASSGGPGGPGGSGGDGGDAGSGGNGGQITIRIASGAFAALVTAKSDGGAGGVGGRGSTGGSGGQGGPPGSFDDAFGCDSTAQQGPNGAGGAAGQDKSNIYGQVGVAGVIALSN